MQPNAKSSLVVDVKDKQHLDPILMELKDSILGKYIEAFSQGEDGLLRYQGRLCVLDIDNLRGRGRYDVFLYLSFPSTPIQT